MQGDRYKVTRGTVESKPYRVIPASGFPEYMDFDETGLYAWLHTRCGYSDAETLQVISEVDANGGSEIKAT